MCTLRSVISLFLASRSVFRTWMSDGCSEEFDFVDFSDDFCASSLLLASFGSVRACAVSEYHLDDSLVLEGWSAGRREMIRDGREGAARDDNDDMGVRGILGAICRDALNKLL